MASFAIVLVVCGALCSIGGMHFPPAEALVTHEERSPFPPLPPTRRYGPPEFVNMKPRSQDWEPGTPPQKLGPGTAEEPAVLDSNPIPVPDAARDLDLDTPLKNPEPGTAQKPAVLNWNPIPVPGTTVAEELPNSVVPPPTKPGLQDLHLTPVPITGEEPSAYP